MTDTDTIEIDPKIKKAFYISGIVFFIVFFAYTSGIFSDKTGREYLEEVIHEEVVKGIVRKKYIDKPNHAAPTLLINGYYPYVLPRDLYDSIEVGDSLYKEKESWELLVVKENGEKYIIDLEEEYKEYMEGL